jgi:hypothetical protein
MKTVMQELIEEIVEHLTYDDSLSEDSRVTYETIRLRCISKLEKEKEQIVEAHGDKYRGGFNSSGAYFDTKTTGEEYYNQTYNQNK